MTDKQLRSKLKTAYDLPATPKGRHFLRSHEQRTLRFDAIVCMELQYMGLKSLLTGLLLVLLLYFAARSRNADTMWIITSLLPIGALMPLVLLSRSERFHMDELEAASRFSLRFVRLVRMLILGSFSLLLLLTESLIVCSTQLAGTSDILLNLAAPYLTALWGGLAVTRRRQGKDGIFGTAAVCILVCFLPAAARELQELRALSEVFCVGFTAVLLLGAAGEGVQYLKESENVSWNLC